VQYEKHLTICQNLWKENPVAKKGVQNIKSFTASEGFRVKANVNDDVKRKIIQGAIDEHWRINEWDEKTSIRVETLAVEGEWNYWISPPNPYTGHIRINKILPETISEIERMKTDAETLSAVRFAEKLEFVERGQSVYRDGLDIVRRDPLTGRVAGEALHLGINCLSGQTRGWSDLLVVADYLDALESLLLGEVDRAKIQRAFVWDILLKDSDPAAREKRKAQLLDEGPPDPGAMIVRDGSEEWNCIAPVLNLNESIAFLEFLMSIIFGGLNMPQHFFSQGGDVNKATAGEMSGPVWAIVRDRKKAIMSFLRLTVEFALQTLLDRGFLGGAITKADLTFEVISRDPERNSYNLIGKMLDELCEGFGKGVDRGFLDQKDAGRSLRTAATNLGLGDFSEPSPESLAQARAQIDSKLTQLRPQLEQQFPLVVKDPGLPEAS
jgi:hypothetical protein